MNVRKTVYVAGPYSKGSTRDNIITAVNAADELMALGYAPVLPHLSHFWDLLSPKPYEMWMELDFAYVARCHALLRLPGESSGADREVQLALDRGVPVFYSVYELKEAMPPEAA